MSSLFHKTLAAALACAALAACQKPAPAVDTAKAADDVKALEAQWSADLKTHDAAKMVAYYAPYATFILPESPPAVGTAAITAGMTDAVKDPAFSVDLKTEAVAVAAAGDLAYTRGTAHETYTDPKTKQPVTRGSHYLTIYKHQADGGWKVVEDVVTPDPAPAPAAAPAGPAAKS